MKLILKQPSVLPGFGLCLGFTLFYLSLIVMFPLAQLFVQASGLTPEAIRTLITSPRVMAALKISLGTALCAALANAFLGLMVAWVLVRYRFWGKRVISAMVDIPFALPTAVAGIALTTLYAPGGWIGKILASFGIYGAFTPLGIVIALMFVGLPFVVRTVEPVLQDMDRETEEAAASLGANKWQVFFKVTLPCLFPALLAGFGMAFARGVGEYGSVIFIAGNVPMVSEILPLLIVSKLEQFDYPGAAVLALLMLLISFSLLLILNILQKVTGSRKAVA